jgi:hypothetical protein
LAGSSFVQFLGAGHSLTFRVIVRVNLRVSDASLFGRKRRVSIFIYLHGSFSVQAGRENSQPLVSLLEWRCGHHNLCAAGYYLVCYLQ